MNSEKTVASRLIMTIITLILSLAGLILIGVLPIISIHGGQATFGYYLSHLIDVFKNLSTGGVALLADNMLTILNIFVYVSTYIMALVFIIKCIIDLFKFNKEGRGKRAVYDSLKLSFTLLYFFGGVIFFSANLANTKVEIGGYLALALGGAGILLTLINYLLVSERSLLSKCLRACLVLVAFATSIMVLMPTISSNGFAVAPGLEFSTFISTIPHSETIDALALASILTIIILLGFVCSTAFNEAYKSVDERKKNDGKSVSSIVLASISLVFVVGALFGATMINPNKAYKVSIYGIISIVLVALTLILTILVFIYTKKEPVKVTPIEFTQPSEENEVTPHVVEEPVEEVNEEETTLVEEEKVIEVAPIVVPVVEENKEEQAKEEAPKIVKKNKEKPAPKKKATAKKEEKKAEVKKNASYHVSKRASDNKWQVFRAGSEKVIKLFDTKIEAEEYTKKMAENQGVSYLSHASKGKNKGRIQKK